MAKRPLAPHPRAEARALGRALTAWRYADGNERLKPSDVLVFLALWWHADDDGLCWPSDALLAQEVPLASASVYAARHRLQKAGLVEREIYGRGRTNRYTLTDPRLPAGEQGVQARNGVDADSRLPARQQGVARETRAETRANDGSRGMTPRAPAGSLPARCEDGSCLTPRAPAGLREGAIEGAIEEPTSSHGDEGAVPLSDALASLRCGVCAKFACRTHAGAL